MKLWNKFLNIGTREEYPPFLNTKLKNTAFISLIILLGGILHAAKYFSRGLPQMTIFHGTEAFFTVIALILMAVGAYRVPRIIVSIAPMLTAFFFKGYVSPPSDVLSPGFYMLVLTGAIVPFLLFDLRERFWLILSLSINLFFMFTLKLSSEWFYNTTDLFQGLTYDAVGSDAAARFNSILGIFGALYYIESQQLKSTLLGEKVQEESRLKTAELESSEVELKKMLEELEQNRQEEKERSRMTELLSEFASLLRNKTNDVQTQYDQIISFIVKSVGANQGSLFIVEQNETTTYLNLEACYAYDRKKFVEQRIEIGQGLVGQSYLEKERTYLMEIPKNYVRITSGLGEATPTCLLVLPMLYQEKVEAIIELASFSPLTEHQLEMLEKMGEALASQVSAYRIQHQTQLLLEKSQTQSEELQAREEELRQNMEELQGTQEDMQRKEQFYLQKIAKLEDRLQTQDDTM